MWQPNTRHARFPHVLICCEQLSRLWQARCKPDATYNSSMTCSDKHSKLVPSQETAMSFCDHDLHMHVHYFAVAPARRNTATVLSCISVKKCANLNRDNTKQSVSDLHASTCKPSDQCPPAVHARIRARTAPEVRNHESVPGVVKDVGCHAVAIEPADALAGRAAHDDVHLSPFRDATSPPLLCAGKSHAGIC